MEVAPGMRVAGRPLGTPSYLQRICACTEPSLAIIVHCLVLIQCAAQWKLLRSPGNKPCGRTCTLDACMHACR